MEEKESFRWLETVDAVESLLPKDLEVWVAGDREADMFELFAMPRRAGLHLVVRATHDRKVQSAEAQCLHEAIVNSAGAGRDGGGGAALTQAEGAYGESSQVQACTLNLVPPRNHLGRRTCRPCR